MNCIILEITEQGVHCWTCWPVDRFRDSWNVLKQDSESVTVQDKETFLVSVILVFFHVRVFNYVSRLVERDKQDYHGKKHSSCSTAIYGAAVASQEWSSTLTYWIMEKLSTGWATVSFSLFPYIHFTQHDAAAVSVCSIPWLQPARVDECTLQAQITVTSGRYHSSCSSKHQSNFSPVILGIRSILDDSAPTNLYPIPTFSSESSGLFL